MSNEIEFKLLIDPKDIRRLQRHPFLTAHTRQKFPCQRLLSIYFDTPELILHRRKIAVRLRRVGRSWIQTVKTAGTAEAGLHQRSEWEWPAAKNTLNFQLLQDVRLRKFFSNEALRQSLRPVFTTDFFRTRRVLAWPNGDEVEFALDRGEIRAGDRNAPICEIELELKSGASERLFAIVSALQQTLPLHPENISKAERGYQLAARKD